MNAPQRAFLNAQVALAAWRAARDAEAQLAHWLTEGRASRDELADRRRRTKLAHTVHQRAQRIYSREIARATGTTGSATGGGTGGSVGGGNGRCR